MNTQVSARISQIKQYISSLNDHVSANDHNGTLNIVNRFKKAVLKQDPQLHANQFLLDCLKTKNQKLQAQLEQLQFSKKNLQEKLTSNKDVRKNMKSVNAGVFISRLTVSLNDVKKVEYDEVSLNCDYVRVYVNSLIGNKYKEYVLAVDFMENVEYKQCYAHLQYQESQVISILIKFQNDRDMQRWVTGLKFGMLIESSKKKEKLFQVKKDQPVASTSSSPPQATNPPPPQTQTHLAPNSYVPMLSFGAGKPNSPSQSIISERKEKSLQKSLNDKMEKNTQRSLVNALSFQTNNFNMASRRSLHPPVPVTSIGGTKRIDLNRPPNLMRIRGLSQNTDNSFQISKIYKKSDKGNSRKQSEDIWKPIINQNYHDKMLETLRSQQANESQQKSENGHNQLLQTFRPPQPKDTENDFRSSRLKSLEDRKKELLNQVNNLPIPSQKPNFHFEINKVSWGGIEQMDDENKSKSSNKFSNKSRRDSAITQSQNNGSKESFGQKKEDKQSQHITQKSEEQSPKIPASTMTHTSPSIQTLQIPKKIKYNGGLGIQLHQVERSESKIKIAKTDSPLAQDDQKDNKYDQQGGSNSVTSQSQSHDHSDSFSHQNHTESEDNNVRAQQLKKGIILTKYSQNGFWPHQKIIYLSENQNDLCYRDLKDKKIKKIKIASITSVEYTRYDKGIIKHVAKIEDDKCLVIRAEMQDGKKKNFQFVSGHPQPLKRFAENLNQWIQYYKKG